MSKRQSDLHGNMQSAAEMTVPPTKRVYKSKWDHLYEQYPPAKIYDMHYNQGMSMNDMSQLTGIERRALLQRYFIDCDKEPRKLKKKAPEELKNREWLTEQLNQGINGVEIAKNLGVSYVMVYSYLEKHGIEIQDELLNKSMRKLKSYSRKPEENPAWVGGKRIARETGYVLVHLPDHPNARKDGYIFEHRLVMSQTLNRPLHDWEIVHHKNSNKSDNRIQNLELRYRDNHPPLKDACCPNCGYEIRWE